MSNTHPERVVDINGRHTIVHKKNDAAAKPTRAVNGVPARATYASPLYNAAVKLALKDMDGALLSASINNEMQSPEVADAIALAALCHRSALRNNRGNMPRDNYINHPLRNTLRLIRLRVTDPDVIIASILHDTVEDAPEEIILTIDHQLHESDASEQSYQDVALGLIKDMFGDYTSEVVERVTNKPHTDPNMTREQKWDIYRAKVRESIKEEGAFLVKLSDFLDNAGSLYHHIESARSMVIRSSRKYLPLVDDFIERTQQSTLLDDEAKRGVIAQLEDTKVRMTEFSSLDP